VTQTVYNPVATSQVTLSANLPATPATGTGTPTSPITSDIDVYDSLGNLHTIALNWAQSSTNNWTMTMTADGTAIPGTATVAFGSGGAGSTAAGTLSSVTEAGLTAASPAYNPASSAAQPAWLSFQVDFGTGTPQTIQLNLGNYGQSAGLTQYAGTQYNLRGLTQNGVPPGAFSSVTTQTNGDISVNYDNGQSRVIAQVPIITFNDPNALQRQNGQAFTASPGSGTPLAEAAGTNGAGTLSTGSIESSNVDIATEFSKLIIAQQAYSANTKMVTTASQMLQQTIDMKQ
jgi:flagellar hook protein FlgE